MHSKALIVLSLAILLVLALALGYWWSAPRLIMVSPPDGASDVLSGTTLRMTFSRPMQSDSVVERLTIEPPTSGTFAWERNVLVFTPHLPWPAGATVNLRLKAGSRASGFWSLPISQERGWSFSIGQPKLAYLYPANAPAQVYVFDVKTSESEPVTGVPAGIQDFEVSSNGAVIYFSTLASREGSSIYRLDLSNRTKPVDSKKPSPTEISLDPVQVLECPAASCQALAISPQADYIAFERTAFPGGDHSGYPQVWIAPLSSGEQGSTPVTEDALVIAGDPSHQTLMPLWSSEGLLVFYDVDTAEYIFIDPREGERARFPNQTGQAGAWHPNGRYFLAPEIVFLDAGASVAFTDLKSLADSHLILFDWQSGATQDLTTGQGIEDVVPAYSPNGALLAFARKYLDVNRWTPGRQIWLMDTETGEVNALTDDPLFNHYDFVWSQSGDRLAYARFDQSALTQPPEIWMIDPYTGQATQLIEGGYSPQWLSP